MNGIIEDVFISISSVLLGMLFVYGYNKLKK
jgi:hypothetical protein